MEQNLAKKVCAKPASPSPSPRWQTPEVYLHIYNRSSSAALRTHWL